MAPEHRHHPCLLPLFLVHHRVPDVAEIVRCCFADASNLREHLRRPSLPVAECRSDETGLAVPGLPAAFCCRGRTLDLDIQERHLVAPDQVLSAFVREKIHKRDHPSTPGTRPKTGPAPVACRDMLWMIAWLSGINLYASSSGAPIPGFMGKSPLVDCAGHPPGNRPGTLGARGAH